MKTRDAEILVLGAGAAGLACAQVLGSAGISTIVLEARDRVGGRIYTVRDPAAGFPVEMGAEFIHGRPRELFDIISDARLSAPEIVGTFWYSRDGSLTCKHDMFPQAEKIFERMDARRPDESFVEFLDRCCAGDPRLANARQWALGYISGFHAADPERIGIHTLVRGMEAEEREDGDHQFRFPDGYARVLEAIQRNIARDFVDVCLDTRVTSVRWREGLVEVTADCGGAKLSFTAPKLVVTLPLSVLQAAPGTTGYVSFDPPLAAKGHALGCLAMGPVIHLALRFREPFWESIRVPGDGGGSMAGMTFLFSQDESFPTWWTQHPVRRPLLTGWAAGPRARRLSGQPEAAILEQALTSLARILPVSRRDLESLLEAHYLHDWQADPFSLGAYSYALVGGADAPAELAAPLAHTLYFAGEATESTGDNATVHGAIRTGLRAAREVLEGR